MTNEIKTWADRVREKVHASFRDQLVDSELSIIGTQEMLAEIAELRAKVESLAADVERWQLARKFLAIEDIEAWSGSEWRGHHPNEEESEKADKAIDAMAKEKV